MSHPFTDIVIPVHNALDYVKLCLESVYQHTTDFRLIIVDDYSDEQTRSFLYGPECLGKYKRNLYIRTNRQCWFTRASNTGLRLVETSKAVLLNSDCIVNDGWMEELYDVWSDYEGKNTHKKVGMVGDWGDPGTPLRYKETYEPDYVTGHCVLYSIAAMLEASIARGDPGRYLDETRQDAIHIRSDRYLCYELNRLGYATVVAYKTPLGHYGGKSWSYDLGRIGGITLEEVD